MSESSNTINDFPSNLRLGVPTIGKDQIATNSSFQLWIKNLEKYGKNFMGTFYTVISADSLDPEWIDVYQPSKEEKVAATLDDSGIDLHLIKLKMDSSSKIVHAWKSMAPKITSFILRAMSDEAIRLVEDRDRPSWEECIANNKIIEMLILIRESQTLSGKATSLSDREKYRKQLLSHKLKPGQKFEDFIKERHDLEKLCASVNVLKEISDESLKFNFLESMLSYPNPLVQTDAGRFLIELNQGKEPGVNNKDIASMTDHFRSLIIVLRTEEQELKFSNKFSVNVAKVNSDSENGSQLKILDFEDGRQGYKVGKNTYDVFEIIGDKVMNIKRYFGFKNKVTGKIELKTKIINNSEQTDIETKDENKVENKNKSNKCFNCGKEGHFARNCKELNKKEASNHNEEVYDDESNIKKKDKRVSSKSFIANLDIEDEFDDEISYNAYNLSINLEGSNEYWEYKKERTLLTDDEIDVTSSDSDSDIFYFKPQVGMMKPPSNFFKNESDEMTGEINHTMIRNDYIINDRSELYNSDQGVQVPNDVELNLLRSDLVISKECVKVFHN